MPEATALNADAGSRADLLAQLSPGVTIADAYRLEEPLGRGAMGVVIAARHVSTDERVALKFLVPDDGARQFQSRFAREARVCAKLRNEHIVRVTDFGVYREALAYMVMECLEGADLRATLRARGDRLDVEVAVDYAVQVCEGLAEVHEKGIVHRDLKPSNLFVTKRADGSELIKILDFGISKQFDRRAHEVEAELTETGMLLGTPKFMAPEQLFGSTTIDARADVWSMAAITYEMLTGELPFEAPTFGQLCARHASGEPPEPPSKLRPGIPPAIDDVVLAALRHRVDERTPTATEFARDLRAALEGRLTRIAPAPTTERRAWLWLVGAAVIATAAVFSLTARTEEPALRIEPTAAASAAPSPSIEQHAVIASTSALPAPSAAPSVAKPALSLAKPMPTPAKSAPTAGASTAPAPSPSASTKPGLKALLEDRQ